jgi:SAM-dependent methyltransferase
LSRLDAAQWSAYWKLGSITTFQDAFRGNYDREVAAFWHGIFASLGGGERLVDLACGNGALALLAADFAASADIDLRIDAVDFAVIQPPLALTRWQQRGVVTLHPQRRMEDTGLPGGAFRMVMSQFGLEYGDPRLCAREIGRLLAPDGARLVAMCHHADSAIVAQARQALRNIAVCRESPAPNLVRRLQQRLDTVLGSGQDPAADTECESLRERLNEAIGRLHDAADQVDDARHFEFFIRGCMAPFGARAMDTQPLSARLALLDATLAENAAFEARMQDLLSAALDDTSFETWCEALEREGLKLAESAPIELDGKPFARTLTFRR